jgi:CheY-like chemotaxis protein
MRKAIRVLVVQDEPLSAMMLEEALIRAGCLVTVALDAAAALAEAEETAFDTLITGLTVRGLAGEGLIARMRARWPSLAVVVLTSSPPPGGAAALQRDGAAPLALLVKPMDPDTMVGRVPPGAPGRKRAPGPQEGRRPAHGPGDVALRRRRQPAASRTPIAPRRAPRQTRAAHLFGDLPLVPGRLALGLRLAPQALGFRAGCLGQAPHRLGQLPDLLACRAHLLPRGPHLLRRGTCHLRGGAGFLSRLPRLLGGAPALRSGVFRGERCPGPLRGRGADDRPPRGRGGGDRLDGVRDHSRRAVVDHVAEARDDPQLAVR